MTMRKIPAILFTTIVLLTAALSCSGCSGTRTPKTAEEVQKTLLDKEWTVYARTDDEENPDFFAVSKREGKHIIIAHDLSDKERYGIQYADYNISKFPWPVSESSFDKSERVRYQDGANKSTKQLFQSIEDSLDQWLKEMGLTKEDIFTLVHWVKENATEEKTLPLSGHQK